MQATIVNDFIGRVPVARAEFTGTELHNVRGVVEVRVADMRTGIDLRDRHLREVMHADSLPVIRFELSSVEPGTASGDSLPVLFSGSLRIHGVTRTVRIPGVVVLAPNGIHVAATTPIDMREYGITPPTRGFGLVRVRVAPVTQVGVRMWFGEAR
jgi:polyisoprenoid-binding protein YceI